jgi:uncharacterized cupin superfamily protein
VSEIVNLFGVEVQHDGSDPPGYGAGCVRVGPLLGAELLGLTVYELPPGESVCPYHYETAEEEWLIVLAGRPTVRTPGGEQVVGEWDTVFFPAGEAGAHKVTNDGDEPARVAIWSNRAHPATTVYPDSGKVGAWPPGKLFRLDDAVDYYEGELPQDTSAA